MNKTDKPITKLTESYLRALIIEIMNESYSELLLSVNARHSSETGKFIPKSQAGVYSLSGRNKFKDSDLETKARGEVSAGSNAIKAKFGMNSSNDDVSCGRIRTTDGSEKTKRKRKCSDYRKGNHYKEGLTEEDNSIESSADLLYIKQLIKQEVEAMTKKTSQRTKSQNRGKPSKEGCSFVDILKGIRAIKTAEEVPAPPRSKKRYV